AHEPVVLVGHRHVHGHRLRARAEGRLRGEQPRQRERRGQREQQVSPRDHQLLAYHPAAARPRARRRRRWPSALLAACLATIGLTGAGRAAPPHVEAAGQPVPSRHVVAAAADAGWTLAITAETASSGLDAARIEASSGAHTVHVPLGDVPVWRMARAVSAMYVHPPSSRLVVLTDQDHDGSGLIVVDLQTARVVTSVRARHMTASPDGRYVAFEEYFSRLDSDWPWNETVYAVIDVTSAAGETMRRPCPFADDRCQGRVIHLPSRQEVCATYRERTGNATCLVPGREPQHARRSPFVWVDAQTLAFVTVDRVRERADVIEARLDPAVELAAAPD